MDDGEEHCSDGYCFELTSMVLALSGAEAGKEFLATPKLLGVLLGLLPIGSPRIQRQLLHVFRRILPQVSTAEIAPVVPGGHSAVEFFLLCVAKALSIQVRAKGLAGAPKGPPEDVLLDDVSTRITTGTIPPGHISHAIATEILELLGSLWKADVEAGEPKGWMDTLKEATAPVVSVLTLTLTYP